MAAFSKKSVNILHTCDRRLVDICTEVIKDYDFSVLCGHRGEEEQNAAFDAGSSNARWGQSKHNTTPSKAVDLAPYPIDWNDIGRFRELAARMQVAANKLGIKIRWGGTFTKIKDYPHFELMD